MSARAVSRRIGTDREGKSRERWSWNGTPEVLVLFGDVRLAESPRPSSLFVLPDAVQPGPKVLQGDGMRGAVTTRCSRCDGTGYVPAGGEWEPDENCAGSGLIAIAQYPTLDNQRDKIEWWFRHIEQTYGVPRGDICGSTRARNAVRARDHLAWGLRHGVGLSLKQVGLLLGGRDHSSVIAEVKRHEARRK